MTPGSALAAALLLAGCDLGRLDPACRVEAAAGPRDAAPVHQPSPGPAALAASGPHPVATSAPRHPDARPEAPDEACPDTLETRDGTPLFAAWPTTAEAASAGRADVAPGRWPVVVFAHGAHKARCEGLHRGFRALHEHWASHGFVVLSVDLQAVGCGKVGAGDLHQRAAGLGRAISAIGDLDALGPLAHHLDADRVVVAGHSRGGGAALMAAADRDVAGVLALQPVDVTHSGVVLRPITEPALVVSAEGDTDVAFPHGQAQQAVLEGPWAWAGLVGGVHAFTGDWLPLRKKDAPVLTRAAQQQATAGLTVAFLGTVLHGWEDVAPWTAGPQLAAAVSEHAPVRLRSARPDDADLARTWQAEGFVADEVVPAYDGNAWERGRLYERVTARRLVPGPDGGRLCAVSDVPLATPALLRAQVAAEGDAAPALALSLDDGPSAAVTPTVPLAAPYQDLALPVPAGTTRACLEVGGAGLRLVDPALVGG